MNGNHAVQAFCELKQGFYFFLNPQANIFHTGILVFSGFICVSYPLIQFPLL